VDEDDRNSTEWRSALPEEWPADVGVTYNKAFQVRHPLERYAKKAL